jgi:hypothetical protein
MLRRVGPYRSWPRATTDQGYQRFRSARDLYRILTLDEGHLVEEGTHVEHRSSQRQSMWLYDLCLAERLLEALGEG